MSFALQNSYSENIKNNYLWALENNMYLQAYYILKSTSKKICVMSDYSNDERYVNEHIGWLNIYITQELLMAKLNRRKDMFLQIFLAFILEFSLEKNLRIIKKYDLENIVPFEYFINGNVSYDEIEQICNKRCSDDISYERHSKIQFV